jgi:hypothetical protein
VHGGVWLNRKEFRGKDIFSGDSKGQRKSSVRRKLRLKEGISSKESDIDMAPKKKNKSSGPNGLEILKWELRKRGIRPTGTQQHMVKWSYFVSIIPLAFLECIFRFLSTFLRAFKLLNMAKATETH